MLTVVRTGLLQAEPHENTGFEHKIGAAAWISCLLCGKFLQDLLSLSGFLPKYSAERIRHGCRSVFYSRRPAEGAVGAYGNE